MTKRQQPQDPAAMLDEVRSYMGLIDDEIWRPVPMHLFQRETYRITHDVYASSYGHVITVNRRTGEERIVSGSLLPLSGYKRVYIGSRKGRRGSTTGTYPYQVHLHRLVCAAFNGAPPPEGNIVRHIDGDPCNNRPSNLAYGSHQDNADDRVRHGRSIAKGARLTEAQKMSLRNEIGSGQPYADLRRRYGVSQSTVIYHRRQASLPIRRPLAPVRTA